MADITKIQLPNNDVYDIKDNISGYVAFASNTNPLSNITSVRTSYAGASGETPRYIPGKWRIQTNRNPQNGDIYVFQTPVASSAAGIYLSVNGTSDSDYHPIILNTTAMMTTHYGAGTTLMVVYEPNSTGSIYELEPTTNDKVTITGIFRVLNFYDANTNTLLRTYASTSTNELPLIGTATNTSMAIPTYTSSYKDNYGGMPATVANRPVIKLSTGEIKIPAGLYLGTASSKLGKITLYNTSNSYTTVIQSGTATANRTLTLPNKTGTLATTGDIPTAATATPLVDGTAAVGSSTKYACEDHVHPTDTSRMAVSLKGAANGVAELDANGMVPSSQLPSYVDDVIEGYYYNSKFYEDSAHTIEITGETGKIYIDLSTEKTYRWSGTAYAEISASLALGETSSTAYRGDRGKTAYDHSQVTSGNPHNVTKSDVGLGNVDNTSDATKKNNFTGSIADGNTGFVTGGDIYTALGDYIPLSYLSSTTLSSLTAAAMGTTANRQYAVGLDANGNLSVNIPWTDTTYVFDGTYDASTNKAATVSTVTNAINTVAATAAPQMDGTAAVGSSTKYARENHVHPTDTTRAAVSTTVTNVSWDSTNQKIQKTINGTTSDVVVMPIVSGTGEASAVGGVAGEGLTPPVASGKGSFAFGNDAQATNLYSFAINRGIASGSNSIAIGGKVTGMSQTEASATASIAIGQSTFASGQQSISIGAGNTASGTGTLAIGNLNEVSGNWSVSVGYRTKASSANQYVFGKDNIEDTTGTYLFILGNGTSGSARSNAMTVDWSGNVTANNILASASVDSNGLISFKNSNNTSVFTLQLPVYSGGVS